MKLPEFEVGRITLGDLVDLVAEQMPDQMAVEYLEPKRISHTYKEFNEICRKVAKALWPWESKKGTILQSGQIMYLNGSIYNLVLQRWGLF